MSYRPLPDCLTIKESKIEGLGLFASRDLREGMDLGMTHYFAEGIWLRTPLGGFINHSEDPNCITEGEGVLTLLTTKPIPEGEELTLDYRHRDVNTLFHGTSEDN